MRFTRRPSSSRYPLHGWLGLGLVGAFWPLNWLLTGLRTHWCFFFLWLGYALAVDGLNVRRRGTSLLTRAPGMFIGLFAVSVPLWWTFELINWRTRNWVYVGRESFGDLEYVLLASLSFSTVVPAVLGTAEHVAGLGFVRRIGTGAVFRPASGTAALMFASGVLMIAMLLAWPELFYPFVWLSLWFVLEPLNLKLGHRTLFEWTGKGDWRPVIALGIGALVCGFLWEMWNVFSYPKWTYRVPGLGFWHVFEMPLLGYLGYIPFALEVFAIVHLAAGLAGRRGTDYVVRGLAP